MDSIIVMFSQQDIHVFRCDIAYKAFQGLFLHTINILIILMFNVILNIYRIILMFLRKNAWIDLFLPSRPTVTSCCSNSSIVGPSQKVLYIL